jgi:cytochrome c2
MHVQPRTRGRHRRDEDGDRSRLTRRDRRVKARVFLALVTLAGCSPESSKVAAIPPPSLHLALRGKEVPALSLPELQKLGDARVAVNDPHEHATLALRAVPVARVLDAALGPAWRAAEEVVVTCSDGFSPAIPVSLFLSREAYFAYAREGGADFSVQESPTKRTFVGPYYVVWKNGGEGPPEPQWPYQVTAVEVTDYASRFAATLPPEGAEPLAKAGFERFRTLCLPCHTINGRGGAVGPELNVPLSVTEYFAEPILRQWIEDPQRVRRGAKMPRPLPPGGDDARAIDEILAYLRAMAGRKILPPGP